jgi:hypothetical protein
MDHKSASVAIKEARKRRFILSHRLSKRLVFESRRKRIVDWKYYALNWTDYILRRREKAAEQRRVARGAAVLQNG